MKDIAAIVLAAGAGTRMKSKKPKVAHDLLGVPLVDWVVRAARGMNAGRIVCVVGHGEEVVRPIAESLGCEAVLQEERRGTADAVASAREALKGFDGSVLILSGDCPLITSQSLEALVAAQQGIGNTGGSACSLLTMRLDDPFGYGRIIRDAASGVKRIVEQKDASPEETAVSECNAGFYCFDARSLWDALDKIDSNNAQGEFYLTDAIEVLVRSGKRVSAVESTDPMECLGVNSRAQLAEATSVMQGRINSAHMAAGVTFTAPDLAWIGPDVKISPDVEILPNVMLMGTTSIGEDSVIGPNTRLTDTAVGCGCIIDETVAVEAQVDDGATCGPRTYLRPGAHLMEKAKAGTSVEIKKSTVGRGSKVPHLSYIGDTTIGEGVNLGAGSITCNYDGTNKHATTIGDNTFVGSDTMMVAPVNIGSDVVIGAGSVVTVDVPDGALCIARSRETIVENWVKERR